MLLLPVCSTVLSRGLTVCVAFHTRTRTVCLSFVCNDKVPVSCCSCVYAGVPVLVKSSDMSCVILTYIFYIVSQSSGFILRAVEIVQVLSMVATFSIGIIKQHWQLFSHQKYILRDFCCIDRCTVWNSLQSEQHYSTSVNIPLKHLLFLKTLSLSLLCITYIYLWYSLLLDHR